MCSTRSSHPTRNRWGVLIAATIIFGDRTHRRRPGYLSAPAKVFGTVLAGVALVYFGVDMDCVPPAVSTKRDDLSPTSRSSPLVTVLWLVGMSQAINLVDGLDGLAAGASSAIGAVRVLPLQRRRRTARDLLDYRATSGRCSPMVAAGDLRRVPAAQLQPGADHDGRRRERCCSGCCWRCRRAWSVGAPIRSGQETVGTTYFFLAPLAIPLADPGRADRRHGLRDRPAGHESDRRLATADKGHLHHQPDGDLGHGHRRSVRDPLDVDGVCSVGVRVCTPRSDRTEPEVSAVRHRRADWHCRSTRCCTRA